MIISNCRPLKRIVGENESGLVFESGDERDLAQKLLELHEDEEKRKQLGEKGRRAVLERSNWEREGGKLGELYRELWDNPTEQFSRCWLGISLQSGKSSIYN